MVGSLRNLLPAALAVLALLCCGLDVVEANPKYNITVVIADKEATLRSVADKFEAENPDYVITIVNPGWGGLFGVIGDAFSDKAPEEGALVDGTQIDLMQVGSTWMGPFVLKLKCLEPLTDYLTRWSTDRDGGIIDLEFAERTEFDYRIAKEWYAVPFWLDARVFFYRKDMYREVLGHDRAPETYQEVMENGRKIADYYEARGRQVAGFAVPYSGRPAESLQGFAAQYISDGASVMTPNRECGFTSQKWKDSLRTYMNYRHHPDPAMRTNRHLNNETSITYMTRMCDSELGSMITGAWFYWVALADCPWGGSPEALESTLGLAVPPKGDTRRATFFGASAMGISSKSKQKDAAFTFLKFLLDPEKPYLLEFMGSDIPAMRSALNSVPDSELPPPTLAMKRSLPFAYPQTFPTLDFPEMGAVEDAYVIQQAIQDMHDDPSIIHDDTRFDALMESSCTAMMKEIREIQIVSGRLVVNEGLSTGGKIGLGIGVSLLVILLAVALAAFAKNKRSSSREMEVYKMQIAEMEEEKKATHIPFEDLEFNKRIGEGAYGEVWSGQLHKTPVAIKKLKVSALTDENLAEFESEAVLMAKLRHPNCVLFMGAVVEPKHMCIVTELMTYGSLYNVLHMKDMYLDQAMKLSFAHDAVLGMTYLHSKGMVHRDLKSLNLLVDDKMNLKVSDFGLTVLKKQAQQVNKDGETVVNMEEVDMSTTMAPAPPGSLYWMAPEVLLGQEPDEKSDIYAFAIVLWEIETRLDPYDGANPISVAHQVRKSGYRPPLNNRTHPTIRNIMERCWDQDPEKRPSFTEVENMLPSMAGASMMGVGSGGSTQGAAKRLHGPLGEVSLVFTDVQNSTALWEAHPIAMRDALALHNQCLRQILRQNNGYEVKTEGDAFMIAFDSPEEAARFCISAQVALLKQEWPEEIVSSAHCPKEITTSGKPLFRGLRVRMGIHTGEPQCQPDPVTRRMDYFGTVVNRAARVSGKATGGQITISEQGFQAIKDLHDEIHFITVAIGAVTLKGLAEPEELYSLLPVNLVDRTPYFSTGINSGLTSGASLSIMPHQVAARSQEVDDGWNHDKTNASTIKHFKESSWAIQWDELTEGQLIGCGTYGEVFRGRYRDNDVAIKKMLQQNLKEETMLAFNAEVILLMSLRHPNILTFMGVCNDAPNMSIVTELLDQSLNQALKLMTPGLALTWKNKIDILLGAANGMSYLHSNKPPILHRDLKSHNLLLDKNKSVRICDFGFSAVKDANRTMTTVGTAAWMAPEVISGLEYGLPADVYSFGIVMWEVLTNTEPFRNQSAINVALTVSDGGRPHLATTPPDVPAGFVDLMKQCWDQKPDKRPTFKEIAAKLGEIEQLVKNAK